ncbi:MAG: hypothetical protein ACI3YG_09705 [Prevotella sp.]
MNKNALFQTAFKDFQSVNGTVYKDERGFFSLYDKEKYEINTYSNLSNIKTQSCQYGVK